MPSITIYIPNHLYDKIKGNPSKKIQEGLRLLFYREELKRKRKRKK